LDCNHSFNTLIYFVLNSIIASYVNFLFRVKQATNSETNEEVAIKILDKEKIK